MFVYVDITLKPEYSSDHTTDGNIVADVEHMFDTT